MFTKIITQSFFFTSIDTVNYIDFQMLNQPCIPKINLFDIDLFFEIPGMMLENLILKHHAKHFLSTLKIENQYNLHVCFI